MLDQLAYFLEAESAAFAQEAVAWYFWSSIASALAFFLFAGLLGWIGWRRSGDQDHHSAMLLAGIAILVALAYVGRAVKAHVAPRVVVIETLRGE